SGWLRSRSPRTILERSRSISLQPAYWFTDFHLPRPRILHGRAGRITTMFLRECCQSDIFRGTWISLSLATMANRSRAGKSAKSWSEAATWPTAIGAIRNRPHNGFPPILTAMGLAVFGLVTEAG